MYVCTYVYLYVGVLCNVHRFLSNFGTWEGALLCGQVILQVLLFQLTVPHLLEVDKLCLVLLAHEDDKQDDENSYHHYCHQQEDGHCSGHGNCGQEDGHCSGHGNCGLVMAIVDWPLQLWTC